jgi:hypothetical protein
MSSAPKPSSPGPKRSVTEVRKGIREDLAEDIGLPEEIEEEIAEEIPLDEAEPDYLDKPDDLAGDNDDYHTR